MNPFRRAGDRPVEAAVNGEDTSDPFQPLRDAQLRLQEARRKATKNSPVDDPTAAEIAFWEQTAVAVASAANCRTPETASNWADVLLKARRERFG